MSRAASRKAGHHENQGKAPVLRAAVDKLRAAAPTNSPPLQNEESENHEDGDNQLDSHVAEDESSFH